MPEITCNANNCVYNEQGYCERKNIRVDTDECSDYKGCTCCDSFENENKSSACYDCSCKNCAGSDANVECFAVECIYNEGRECVADYISIEGSGARERDDTFCDSFRSGE